MHPDAMGSYRIHHSITSSALASKVGGTVRPSALAVAKIDDKLEFGRGLNRHVGRLFAFENAVDIKGRAPALVGNIDAVTHQAAVGDEVSEWVERRNAIRRRPVDSQPA